MMIQKVAAPLGALLHSAAIETGNGRGIYPNPDVCPIRLGEQMLVRKTPLWLAPALETRRQKTVRLTTGGAP